MFNIKRVNTVLRHATYYSVNWDRFLICYAHYHLKIELQYCAYIVYCKVYAAGTVYAAGKVYAAHSFLSSKLPSVYNLFQPCRFVDVPFVTHTCICTDSCIKTEPASVIFMWSYVLSFIQLFLSLPNWTYKGQACLEGRSFFWSFLYYFRIILIYHCKNSNLSVRWMFNTF